MGKYAFRGDAGDHRGENEETAKRKRQMDEWLDRYPPTEDRTNDLTTETDTQRGAQARKRMLEMEPQAVLDLHGLTSEQAVAEINRFIEESVKNGLFKVLIVHGKGNHSPEGGILAQVTAECVSKHPLAGENALSKGRDGGRGARWVVLRQRSR